MRSDVPGTIAQWIVPTARKSKPGNQYWLYDPSSGMVWGIAAKRCSLIGQKADASSRSFAYARGIDGHHPQESSPHKRLSRQRKSREEVTGDR